VLLGKFKCGVWASTVKFAGQFRHHAILPGGR